MPYDDWKTRDPHLEELPMDDDEFVEGEDDFEVEIEARGARAHSIERDAMEHGLKATVGPDTVYIVGPFDKLFTLLATTVGMSPEEADQAMKPVVKKENDGMNEDELNPVFDDDIEMRDEKHADPSGREWMSETDEENDIPERHGYCDMCGNRSSHLHAPTPGEVNGLCPKCHNEYGNPVDQASMIEADPAAPTCADCGKILTNTDSFESEDGNGQSSRCEDCSELPSVDQASMIETPTNESVGSFDKFMDSVVLKENSQKKVEAQDTPQRIYNKRYREKALNRMRIRRLP